MIGLRKKILFIAALVGIGLAASALIGVGMIAFGWINNPFDSWLRGTASYKRRILVVGDSFLSWWPIEHCLHRDIERFCVDNQIGVTNAAAGGYGPIEYHERILSIVPEFQPGLVLICYFVGNDLTDVMYRQMDEPPRSIQARSISDLFSPGMRRVRSLSDYFLPTATAAETKPDMNSFDWEAFREHGIDPQMIEYAQNRLRHPEAIGAEYVNPWVLELATTAPDYLNDNILVNGEPAVLAWERVQTMLQEAVATAQASGADVCLMAIPASVQIDRSHFEFYRKCTFNVSDALLDSRKPQDLLEDLCENLSIDYVDLLPAFEGAPNHAELYWPNDEHLSEAGHRLAMQVLLERHLEKWERRTRPRGNPPDKVEADSGA